MKITSPSPSNSSSRWRQFLSGLAQWYAAKLTRLVDLLSLNGWRVTEEEVYRAEQRGGGFQRKLRPGARGARNSPSQSEEQATGDFYAAPGGTRVSKEETPATLPERQGRKGGHR